MNKMSVRISIFLLLGAIYMITLNGCSGAGRFKKYSSEAPDLNITMDYISGWEGRETRGTNGSYADVYFGEPRDKAGTKAYRAFMQITSFPVMNAQTVEVFEDSLVANKLKFKDGKLLGRTKVKIPAGEAADLGFSFKIPDRLYSVKSKFIPMRERIIVFEGGGRFYTVKYQNAEEDFDRYSKDFDHIIRSLRVK